MEIIAQTPCQKQAGFLQAFYFLQHCCHCRDHQTNRESSFAARIAKSIFHIRLHCKLPWRFRHHKKKSPISKETGDFVEGILLAYTKLKNGTSSIL